MDDEDLIADELLDRLAEQGARRCDNERGSGTCVVGPPMRPHGWREELRRRHAMVCTPQELSAYNIELLRAADDLLQFLDANVGESVDYPLRIEGENGQAVGALQHYVGRLRSPVGMLLEI